MSRWTGLGVGVATLAVVALAAGPVRVKASDEVPAKPAQKNRQFEFFRGFGGAHLGVTLEDREDPGAVVKDVRPDTPAAKAGLQAGDVIVRYQGERVEGAAALARMVRETPAGRRVEIEVERNGSSQTLSTTLEKGGGMHQWAEGLRGGDLEDFDIELPDHIEIPEIPEMPEMSAVPPVPPVPPMLHDGDRESFRRLFREYGGARKLGIEYQEVSGQLAQYFKLGEERGVLVCMLRPFSNLDAVRTLAARNVSSFSMDLIPRTTRAQRMDALSSMATAAGYKAVLLAATTAPRLPTTFTTVSSTAFFSAAESVAVSPSDPSATIDS